MKEYKLFALLFLLLVSFFSTTLIVSASSPQSLVSRSQSVYVTKDCPVLTVSLYRGMRDKFARGEVSKLQNFLAKDLTIYPSGLVTGYFGRLTEDAVKRWQVKYEIVFGGDPASTGHGVVGPKTRKKIREICNTAAFYLQPIIEDARPTTTTASRSVETTTKLTGTTTVSQENIHATKPVMPRFGTPVINSPFLGSGNTAVLLIKFPDIKDDVSFDKNYTDALVFGENNSLSDYIQEVSYDKYRLVGKSYGWFTMPHELNYYCKQHPTLKEKKQCKYYDNGDITIPGNMLEDTIKIAESSVDFSSVERIILVTNTTALNCGTEATLLTHGEEYVPIVRERPNIKSVILTNREEMLDGNKLNTPLQILIHEFGHNLGMMHAGGWHCKEKVVGGNIEDVLAGECIIDGYEDKSDPMGSSNQHHFSAAHKELAGWLSSNQVLVANNDGEYILDQLELPSDGYKALKIPLTNGNYYSLEYRTTQGYDADDTDGRKTDGIFLRLQIPRLKEPLHRLTTLRPYEPVPLIINPGAPFVDLYRGIKVEVVEKNKNWAKVKIFGVLTSTTTPQPQEVLGISNTELVTASTTVQLKKGATNLKLMTFSIYSVDMSAPIVIKRIQILCNACEKETFNTAHLYRNDIQIGSATPVFYEQWGGLIIEFDLLSAGVVVEPTKEERFVFVGDFSTNNFHTSEYTHIRVQIVEGDMTGTLVRNRWNAFSGKLIVQ